MAWIALELNARHSRWMGMACGVLHAVVGLPLLLVLWLHLSYPGHSYVLLVVRTPDAPAGAIGGWIDGERLTPRLAGEAGLEFQPVRRKGRDVALTLEVEGAPGLTYERRLRLRDDLCPVVALLDREGFRASQCLWRPAYWN